MRLILLVLAGFLFPSVIQAQERWQRLPGAASAFQVDLHSLRTADGFLRARVQTADLGGVVLVQEVEVRCGTEEIRTIARFSYDNDTGRPITTSERQEADKLWVSYPFGSEGHALVPASVPWGVSASCSGALHGQMRKVRHRYQAYRAGCAAFKGRNRLASKLSSGRS